MNAFEKFIYQLIDMIDPPLTVFLLGGFVISMICGVLVLTPWYRSMPHRIWLAVSGAFPVVVFIYGRVFDLFVRGRHLGLMLALSPILLVFIPTGLSLWGTIRIAERNKQLKCIAVLATLLIGQIWATLVCWLATNYGFMGASC